jgi:hypothetical protein
MDVKREGQGYVIIDDGAKLGPFSSMAVAFTEVLARGGRVHLTWSRRVVAGNTVPRHFEASFQDKDAGGIAIIEGGFAKTGWQAFPRGHNRETNRLGGGAQIVDTKDEAVAFIERRFTELMAGDARPLPNAYAKAKGG